MVAARRTLKSRPMRSGGGCPAGHHPRKAYTIKRTGTRVAGRCVRSTTSARETHAAFLVRTRKRMSTRLRGIRTSRRGVTRCPSGQIVRAPYVRIRLGKRSFVPAGCIPNVGAPGKGLLTGGPGIGPLRKGELTEFGYDNVTTMSEARRHLALARAVSAYGSLTVWRKLNAVYIYTRRSSPASSRIFKADRDWIKEHYGIAAF